MTEELYCGVDLHSNNGVYQIVAKDGSRLWCRRLRNEPGRVLEALSRFKDQLKCVAIESTYNWYWLSDCLAKEGYRVVLANPSAMQPYAGKKRVDDKSDAGFVAELLRLDILPTGWICPPEQRALRDLLRRRLHMVNARTSYVLSLQSMFTRQTGTRFKRAVIENMDPEQLQQLLTYPELSLVAHSQLKMICEHDAMIETLEKQARSLCRPKLEYTLLTSVPGIGPILAMTIMLEIGDIARFCSPGHLSSYCRAVKATRTSNGKTKGSNNARNGNKYLGWAFIEAANHMIRVCGPARKWYQKKAAKTLPVVGRKALSSKLSKAVWYMLAEMKPFDLRRVFG